jgi:nicotinate-nucleotide pyrophosphorylase (carboxylating)
VPADAHGVARFVARGPGVLAGIGLVARSSGTARPDVEVDDLMRDGDTLAVGDVGPASVRGPLRAILTGERTALNLSATCRGGLGDAGVRRGDRRDRLRGARHPQDHTGHAHAREGRGRGRRRGQPPCRPLRRPARQGQPRGGCGRDRRGDPGRARGGGGLPVQVEVDDLDQLDDALDAGARDVLLDNFTIADTTAAVARVRSRADETGAVWLESSGRIDLANVRDYASTGVDSVAVGAVTHSAPQLDLGLDLETGG